jgi:hypothetical protein
MAFVQNFSPVQYFQLGYSGGTRHHNHESNGYWAKLLAADEATDSPNYWVTNPSTADGMTMYTFCQVAEACIERRLKQGADIAALTQF